MSNPDKYNRPLSPHLGVYRWQLSSISSILIRLTGMGLSVSFALIIGWLCAAAYSETMFALVDAVLTSWLGRIILIATLWGIFYHLLGGIRHLIFDFGYGLDMRQANTMGWVMVFGSAILCAIVLMWLGTIA